MRRRLLWYAIGALALMAAVRLGYHSWRLLLDPGFEGAIDLRGLQTFVVSWYEGRPTYRIYQWATHPPATLAAMWPLTGWLPFAAARWLWAAVTAALIAGIAAMGLREAKITGRRERWAAVLLLLAMAPTAMTIGNGQMTFLIVAPLLAAVLLLRHRPPGWGRDLAAGLLILISLLKPQISVPFLPVFLFALGGVRPVALAALGYVGLTAFALSFQDGSALTIFGEWLGRARQVGLRLGHVNVHVWLRAVGAGSLAMPASAGILAAVTLWTYRNRRADPWTVLGAVAVVARLWTYHGSYDDLLVLFPLIAIARRIRELGPAIGARAAAAAGAFAVLAPVTPHRWPGAPHQIWEVVMAALWLAMLAYFMAAARRETRRTETRATRSRRA